MNKLPRREFLKLSGAEGVGLAAWPLVNPAGMIEEKPARPDTLVFFIADHDRWPRPCCGKSELKMPDPDSLAAPGGRQNATCDDLVGHPDFWATRSQRSHRSTTEMEGR